MTKIIVSSILLFCLALFAYSNAKADDNVFRAQFTTQVSKKEPVDNLTKLENVFTSVYFFTDIRECVSCKVEHVWSLDGKHIYTQKGVAKYPRYRWWSKKTLNDDMLGKWTVKVKINGKERVKRNLKYFAPSETQLQQAPIQKRLQLEDQNRCEIELRHWSGEMKKTPDDGYVKYMMKTWDERCNGK